MGKRGGERRTRVLLCVQAFPPLAKNAGGVAKRYLSLCRALIDGLGYEVLLLTPVAVEASGEPEVDSWLATGFLRHLKAGGVQVETVDGKAMFLDVFSLRNTRLLVRAAWCSSCDIMIMDDVPFRMAALLLARSLGVPTVTTSHTDGTRLKSYRGCSAKCVWRLHMASTHMATIHASVSRVFADIMRSKYWVPVQAIWPPILWSGVFRRPLEDFRERAAAQRAQWIGLLGFEPNAILLSVSRWSHEKRIHLLPDALPDGCALVIVGDSTSEYADTVEAIKSPGVLPLRKMLNGEELRVAYAAADLLVSASDFETLGNVVIEAWCAGTPVAVQPAQGHLEFVEDGKNSYFVDFDNPSSAKRRLGNIIGAGANQTVQPALDQLGERLRNQDFPREVHEALIEPALAAGASWQRCCRRWLVEPIIRNLCFLAWIFIWLILAPVTRLLYLLSREPRFRFLPRAGAAVEPGGKDLGSSGKMDGHSAPKQAWVVDVGAEDRSSVDLT